MANIILPGKWTQQPQYPVEIDWSNPLVNNLVVAATPVSDINLANGKLPQTKFGITNTYDDGITYTASNGSISWDVEQSSEFTFFSFGSFRNGIQMNGGIFSPDFSAEIPTVNNLYFGIQNVNATYIPLTKFWYDTKANFTDTAKANDPTIEGAICNLAATSSASRVSFYVNGKLGDTTTDPAKLIDNTVIRYAGIMNRQGGNNWGGLTKGRTGFLLYNRVLSDLEIKEVSENPWQILKRRSRRIYVGGVAGGATLAATATSQATASADLTTAIPITAAALGIGTATASLSTAIPLSGVAASVASGSGTLIAQVGLSAEALAQAVSTAALSSGIILTAAAVAQAAAAGTLSSAIQLIANAAAQASAPASLTAGSSGLAANAQASASASAELTIQIQLSAAALAQATSSASLTAASSGLSAAASATASAQGDITTQIKLSATALAEAIAVGGLTARIDLAANAITTADASAWLLTAVQLAADASVISTAEASLTGGSLSVVRYQALTVDVSPIELTVDVSPIELTADVFPIILTADVF